MNETKITNLKREVKERLSLKKIPYLSDYKLKMINMSTNDIKKIQRELDNNLIKIGSSLKEDAIPIYQKGYIDIKVTYCEDDNVKRMGKALLKGNAIDILEVTIREGDMEEKIYTSMSYTLKTSQEGSFYFRNNPKMKFSFIRYEKILGLLFFINKLREYIKENENMALLMLSKYIQLKNIYFDKEHQEKMNILYEKYNIPLLSLKGNYIKDLGEHKQNFYKENGLFNYMNWENGKDFFPIESIFESSRDGKLLLYSLKNTELLSYFFNFLYELNKEEEYEVTSDMRISSDYARSYETKKNIPKKIQNKMETTLFKKHFGYVEFDELTDIKKIEHIEKEWEYINKKVAFSLAQDHSLRFRRLGNHKAAGLYFPAMRAVCIDLGGPSSLIHEILHMIDYTTLSAARLSSMFKFRPIIERYKEVTNNKVASLEDNNTFKKTWKGKSKYNKEYYHSASEIFARCGEIYVKEILGIDSSLVKTGNEILYPVKDEILMQQIKKYYATVIQTASTIEVKEEVASKKEQISFFD